MSTKEQTLRKRRGVNIPKEVPKESHTADRPLEEEDNSFSFVWNPPFRTALQFLLAFRLLASTFIIISDCDEVFNYWEPTHYLMYNKGFETWEYSPEFGLRSYFYVGVYAVLGTLARIFASDKITVFYILRCLFGVASAYSEAYLYKALSKTFKRMAVAVPAFLPNSFCMLMLTLATASYLLQKPFFTTLALGSCVLIGSPFTAVAGLPLLVGSLLSFSFTTVLLSGVVVTVLIVAPALLVDGYFFGKVVAAPLQIVLYNAVGGSDTLYGVEPLSYYIKNLLMNFGPLPALVALLPLLLLLLPRPLRLSPSLNLKTLGPVVGGLYLWGAIMATRPHKEERFFYPVYPFLLLAAAAAAHILVLTVDALFNRADKRVFRPLHFLTRLFQIALIAAVVVTGLSRTTGLIAHYGAVQPVYATLAADITASAPPDSHTPTAPCVCVGKEWHRFPSSFFLPEPALLGFVRNGSDFVGQLPQYFPGPWPQGSREADPSFNGDNRDVATRYTAWGRCDYFVDFVAPEYEQVILPPQWTVLVEYPFLIPESSPPLTRAFYIPFLDQRNSYGTYTVYKKTSS